jgi:phage terminase small subunit
MATEKWPPPADLEDIEKREWRAKRNILKQRGDLNDEDDSCLMTLERLVRARQLLRLARMEREHQLTATGSMGQLVVHPLIGVENKAEADIAAALSDLLMTPKSRKSDDKDDRGLAGKPGGGRVARGAFGG